MNETINLLLAQVQPAGGSVLGKLLIPVLIVAIVLAFIFIMMAVASRYKRIPPNAIGIFYGRKYKTKGPDGQMIERGFLVMTGGGRVLMPVVEKFQEMSTAAFQVEVSENDIPSKKNVGVHVRGVATCRVSTVPEDQGNAVTAFLGKTQAEIDNFVAQILKGHIRSIVGKMEVEELLRDRATFNQKVVEESSGEFRQLGLQIITLVIQEISDAHGYIAALGKQEIAAKLRDANIQVAEADKETAIKVSNAKREALNVEAENATKVAEAQKKRDVEIATFKRETETTRAIAETAFAIAQAEQQKTLVVKTAERDSAEKEAQTLVQEKEAERRKKELEATTITEAEANRRATVITAEGNKQVAELKAQQDAIEATGTRNALIQTGEGTAKQREITANAEAAATRTIALAKAEGDKANLLAQADGEKAKLLAQADGAKAAKLADAEGQRAVLLATAEGKQRYLLAEAEGTLKLAEALKQLDERGQLILFLDRLPLLLDKGGDAGAKIAKEMFGPLGEAIGAIGPVQITDLGGGNAAKEGIAGVAGLLPSMLTGFFAKLKASGVDASQLMGLLKMDPKQLAGMIGAVVPKVDAAASSAAPASTPATS